MQGKELYSTGEFAKKANVSIRTIHFYEKKGLIRPLKIAENGYRYYGEQEFARLQRILTLKILGFSLEEIQALSLNETDADYLQQSLEQQRFLMKRKIRYFQTVEKALGEVSEKLKREKKPNWNEITNLIRIANMDREPISMPESDFIVCIRKIRRTGFAGFTIKLRIKYLVIYWNLVVERGSFGKKTGNGFRQMFIFTLQIYHLECWKTAVKIWILMQRKSVRHLEWQMLVKFRLRMIPLMW